MELNNADEATRMVETILNLKRENVLDKKEAFDAIRRVPYYSEVVGPQKQR